MIKNIIYLAAFTFIVGSCSDPKKDAEASQASDTASKTPPPAPVATLKNGLTQEDYDKGLALIAKSDCLTCHKISEKFVGPAYKDVANRYTAQPDTLDKLATKIIKGGVGVWGPVPMPPHPNLSKADAVQMVKYVLTIE